MHRTHRADSLPGPSLIGSKKDSTREMRLESLMIFSFHHFTEMAELILYEKFNLLYSHFLGRKCVTN